MSGQYFAGYEAVMHRGHLNKSMGGIFYSPWVL